MSSAPRVPPYSAAAEAAVLGAVLLDNTAWMTVRATVQEEDFYLEGHRVIYRTIGALLDGGSVVDAVTLGERLRQEDALDRVGGAAALAGLTDQATVGAAVAHHARLVADQAAVRRMIYAAQEVAATGYAYSGDAAEYLDAARSAVVRAAQQGSAREAPRPLDADFRAIYRTLEGGRVPPEVVRTGITVIDRATGGLWPELTMLGARPGMGKSCLALNIGINAAQQGRKVCYLTLEDCREIVAIRTLARFSGVPAEDIRQNTVPRERYGALLEGIRRASGHPLRVGDTPSLSASQIAQIVARERDQHGLDLLIVDLLTELRLTRRKGDTDTLAIEEAARTLRDLTREWNLPILLLHQLNRGMEGQQDRRPGLEHLRRSGDLEGIARAVWLMYRPAYYLAQKDQTGEADLRRDGELIVAKANHGRTGLLFLYLDLARMYVRSWDRSTDGPWPGHVDHYQVPAHFRDDPGAGGEVAQGSTDY